MLLLFLFLLHFTSSVRIGEFCDPSSYVAILGTVLEILSVNELGFSKIVPNITTLELTNVTKSLTWCEMQFLWWLIRQGHWADNFVLNTPMAGRQFTLCKIVPTVWPWDGFGESYHFTAIHIQWELPHIDAQVKSVQMHFIFVWH